MHLEGYIPIFDDDGDRTMRVMTCAYVKEEACCCIKPPLAPSCASRFAIFLTIAHLTSSEQKSINRIHLTRLPLKPGPSKVKIFQSQPLELQPPCLTPPPIYIEQATSMWNYLATCSLPFMILRLSEHSGNVASDYPWCVNPQYC